MSLKIFFVLLAVIALIAGIAFFYGKNPNNGKTDSSGSTGFIVGKNSIYAPEQAPGRKILIAITNLEKPGFVVIHEDNEGAPSKILGVSRLIPQGETKKLEITASREIKDGETLYAMIHLDNGDRNFDAADDKPALDSISGEPVTTIFTVTEEAEEPNAANL